MLSLRLARRATKGHRRALLEKLRTGGPADAQVVLATPRRFLSTRKLIRPNEAIDGMLEVFTTAQALCDARGLSHRLAVSETPLPHAPRLYLSHHTVETAFTAALRARGTQVWHIKAADIPGRTVLDPMGFSGWSSLASPTIETLPLGQIDPAAAAQGFDAAAKARVSKYAQAGDAPLPEEPYVFVALQTIGDMVQKKAFVPMLDMLAMVVARFAGTGLTVAIKRHPRCRSRRVARALTDLRDRPGVVLTSGDIHALMAGAQAVFTVNSGVGSEAMVHDVPIYCFGASDYAAVAHQIRSAQDLARLTDPIHPKVSGSDLRRFHHYYRNTYQIDRAGQLVPRLSALLEAACGG